MIDLYGIYSNTYFKLRNGEKLTKTDYGIPFQNRKYGKFEAIRIVAISTAIYDIHSGLPQRKYGDFKEYIDEIVSY